MSNKKYFTLLLCVFLFTVISFQTQQPVDALPFDGEYTNQDIGAGNWYKVWDTMNTGDVITGYFETHLDTQGLDFFICDSANLAIWEGGLSATVYELETNMHTLGFSFTVPYGSDWYCVFSNFDGISTVTADIGVDVNGDNTPYYSSSTYDYSGYGIVLENEEHHAVSHYFDAGTTIDGAFSTFFPTDGVDFFICDETNYNLWDSGGTATGYSVETDMYHASIDTFEIPTSGVWYVVFYAASEGDTITVSYGIQADTSGVATTSQTSTTTTSSGGSSSSNISIIGLVAGLVILLILCVVCRSKKKDSGFTPSQPTVDHYVAPPSSPSSTSSVREREIVRDRVLVICPYCGSKNEQGVLNCQNCDAEL
jgi:hypothetical protein